MFRLKMFLNGHYMKQLQNEKMHKVVIYAHGRGEHQNKSGCLDIFNVNDVTEFQKNVLCHRIYLKRIFLCSVIFCRDLFMKAEGFYFKLV